MKKFFVNAGIGVIALVTGAVAWGLSGEATRFLINSATEDNQQAQQQVTVAEALEISAKEFRKQLPLQIDEVTILQNVVNVGEMLIYHYRMSVAKDDIDVGYFHEEMTESLEYNVCNQKEMSSVLSMGGSYRYLYIGSGGKTIDEITITEADC